MPRLLAVVACLLLLPTGSALADHLDPQKRYTPRDQARARAMLLRPADLVGYRPSAASSVDTHLTCRALDESDLTVTGEGESRQLTAGISFVSSLSAVYGTRAEAARSWRRGTSAAGTSCLRSQLRREFARVGARLASLRRITFPRMAQGAAAYRLVLAGASQGATLRVYVDLVVLLHGRAQVALFVGSALDVPPRDLEVRLARLLAGRMASAMRGS